MAPLAYVLLCLLDDYDYVVVVVAVAVAVTG